MPEEKVTPPFNMEAEKSLLGSMLMDAGAAAQACEELQPENFYAPQHRSIFAAMQALVMRGEPVDTVTLAAELERAGQLDSLGGVTFISQLALATPTASNFKYYMDIVVEKSVQRQLLRAGGDISTDALRGEKPLSQLLDEAEKRIFDISLKNAVDSMQPIQETLTRSYIKIGELMKLRGSLTGLGTGFYDLDKKTSGLQKSDLLIIAGRPSMGKTSFALNIAQYAATHDAIVVVFSLEMSAEQLVMRMLCSEAEVDMQRVKTGKPTDTDLTKLGEALQRLSGAKLFIDDSGMISVAEIRSKCRRLKLEHGLDMIVIDYLQLMRSSGRTESRLQEVSELTRSLKVLARELDIPIVLLSQLSRAPEQRTDHHPMMSDLRESGSIEQDADVVILLYREGAYDPAAGNVAEAIIAKHRNGPTGTVELAWVGEYTKFKKIATGYEE
jgi:replicative DNA helicase